MNEAQVRQLVEEKIAGTGCFIVEVRVKSGKIVVLLDKPEGITIQECSQVSRFLAEQLEPSGILENHEMEVSSPGMDQPLKVFPQYLRRVGRTVTVLTKTGPEKTGVMTAVETEGIHLEETITRKEKNKKISETVNSFIPFSEIKETKVVISFK